MCKRRAGFTILDVMMAILVMTIGVTGLLAIQLTSLSANTRARELMEAVQLCQDKVEELRLMPLPLPLPPSGGEIVDSRGCSLTGDTRPACGQPLPGTHYIRTWTSDPGRPGRFEVRTSWTSPDGTIHGTAVSDAR